MYIGNNIVNASSERQGRLLDVYLFYIRCFFGVREIIAHRLPITVTTRAGLDFQRIHRVRIGTKRRAVF